MRILLIRPSWEYPFTKEEATYNRIWIPLELATSAAVLEKDGHAVSILDGHALRLPPGEIAERAKSFEKVFVSSSSYDRWQCPNVNITSFLETVNHVRKQNECLYVLGYHGTVKPREILEVTQAKAVIRGEPELTIRELCRNDDLSRVEGITYCKNGEAFCNPDRPLLNMDDLPHPAFHLLDMGLYFYEALGKDFAMFEGSRGCPYSCYFCVLTMFGQKYRRKSPEKLIEEVDRAIQENNVKSAYFMDLEFAVNKKLVHALCDHLIEKDYDFIWTCQTRGDSVDREMLEKMREAKCELIHFGVESGSQTVLDSTNKGITLKSIERGVVMAKEAGIRVVCFFLLGFPGETEDDMKHTIRFAKKLNPHYASFHLVLPYPGTRLYVSSGTPGESENIKKGLFPVDYERKVPLPRLEKLLRKAVLEYYLRPSYVWRALKNGTFVSPLKLIHIFFRRLRKL